MQRSQYVTEEYPECQWTETHAQLQFMHQEIGLKKIRLDKVLKYTKYP